jgi:hypothetical protein
MCTVVINVLEPGAFNPTWIFTGEISTKSEIEN